MNRNQKIAIGCGGAGCLGLIVLSVAGVIGYLTYTNTGSSIFANNNANSNSNLDLNTNSDNANENSNTAVDDADDSTSSMSDDDKHKLFQAAGVTKDSALILKVLEKIGFPSGTGPGYEKFIGEHFNWAMKNLEFMQTVNTPEKGRAYVEEHLDD
jgi:hypothetical protein